jgi:hypothetical protein
MFLSSGVHKNLKWGGGVINKNILFSFFIITQKKKKMQSRQIFMLRAFTLNSSIICSVDNGISRCMFINANPYNRDSPVVFHKYVFKL